MPAILEQDGIVPEFEPFIGDSYFKNVIPRMKEYFLQHKLTVSEQLGYGKDGLVYSTKSMTVVKGLLFSECYVHERDAYRRLEELGVIKIKGWFSIPKLIRYDDARLIIEMRQVTPPYIIDFAGAGLGKPLHEFDEETLQASHENQKENFGEDWDLVQSALSELRSYGIYFSDVSTNNIRCR